MAEIDGFYNTREEVGGGGVCDLCGSTNFFLEQGFYFCVICSTQSQQTQEYVEAEEFQGARMPARTAGVFREQRTTEYQSKDQDKAELDRFEAFNYILKAMTDRLLDIGFPTTFKAEIFDLWTSFLARRKVAFVNKPVPLAPFQSRKHNYHSHSSLQKPKRDGPEVDDDNLLSTSQVKKRRSTTQRKAIETGYVEHASQMSTTNTQFDELVPKIPKNKKTVHRKEPEKPVKPPKSHTEIVKVIESYGVEDPNQNVLRHLAKIETFTLKDLLALIFIALRQAGCSVLYLDVIRLFWDGTLFVNSLNLVHGLSKKLNLKSDVVLELLAVSISNFDDTSTKVNYLIEYLQIADFQYPTLKEFLPKFMDDLVLPRELECLIYQMERMLPLEEQISEESKKKFKATVELHILGVITTVLRMLFGLDDVTEKYQSEFARTVNKVIEKEVARGSTEADWLKLFVIEDWFEFIRYRENVVRSELFSQTMYSPLKPPNLNRLNDLVDRFAGQRGDDDPQEKCAASRKEGKQMFQGFLEEESGSQMPSLPNYITARLPKQSVIHQFVQNHPAVNYPNFSKQLLMADFTKQRIDFVHSPQKYVDLLRKAGYKVRVIPGDARTYKPSEEQDTLVLFQPYKSFDDWTVLSPKSLKCVLEVCTTMITGTRAQKHVQIKLKRIIAEIGDAYCERCLSGAVPIFPYSDTDSDVTDGESVDSDTTATKVTDSDSTDTDDDSG